VEEAAVAQSAPEAVEDMVKAISLGAAAGNKAADEEDARRAAAAAVAEEALKKKGVAKEKEVKTLTLTEAHAAMWRPLFEHLRAEASVTLNKKRARFMGLRKFSEIAAKKKAEALEKKRREEEEDAQERRRAEMEANRPKKSLLQLIELEAPEVANKNYAEYAESHFNLNRKGFFKSLTTVDKVLGWKNEVRGKKKQTPFYPGLQQRLTPHPPHTPTLHHARRLFPRHFLKCPPRS